MTRRLVLAPLILLGFMLPLLADEPANTPEKKPSFWMQKKLDHSTEILAGLASEDFEAIGKNARSMAALNQLEKWARANTAEYATQLKMFQYANKQLVRAADDENLDRATWAYVQMTLTCVNCHKLVRDVKKEKTTESESNR